MGHELIQGSQFQLFSRGVNAAEGGAEGDHVQVRELLQEEAALQTGVDGLNLRLVAEELHVGLAGDLQAVNAGFKINKPVDW